MKIIERNLIITKKNENDFKDITEIKGSIDVRENATFNAPKLEELNYVDVSKNATFNAPKLERSNYVYVSKNATFNAPKLERSNYVYVSKNATFNAPKLEKSWSIDVRENATFNAPKLKKSGGVDLRENAAFNTPQIEIANNTAKINNQNYPMVYNDNIPFFVEKKRRSKGVMIYAGFMRLSIKSGVLKIKKAYLVEEGTFSAHGPTLKKALEDLKFKIASEKLRNEPINADTKITVEIYRMITGACEIGCQNFMDDKNIPYKIINKKPVENKPILAKDLLPMLKETNTYGYDKFKQLVTF